MKRIKYIILTACLLASVSSHTQEVEQIVQQYKSAIAKIHTVHCQIEQLDTFVTGTVWHHFGQLTMLRNPSDSLFGFQFKASKDVGGEALYDGHSEFQIDHKKRTYEVDTDPKAYIVGSPGGQLVVPELMSDQDMGNHPELVENEEYFVLRYQYPDLEEYEVREREKKVFLDKASFLPVKVIDRRVALGKKQVVTRIISEVQLNRAEDITAFQKDFLSDYTMEVEELDKDIHKDLLQTQVRDFPLETFAGQQVSTHPKENKVLLLDFWEVWCGPCVQSMPKVQELADKYGAEGLDVIGVLIDKNSKDSAQKLIKRKGFRFTQAIGDQNIREYFKVWTIPQYVLIDQDGIIQQVYQGYDGEMEDRIKVLLTKAK